MPTKRNKGRGELSGLLFWSVSEEECYMASITASPTIVPVVVGFLKGTTRITWSTGDNTRGKVFVSVIGKPGETQVDGGSTGATNGSKDQEINLGETRIFRLRQAIPPRAELASVTVTTVRSAGPPFLAEAEARLARSGLFQDIFALKVSPGLDYVDFSFRTSQPTVPIITLTTGAPTAPPGTLVTSAFPLFKGDQVLHEVRVGNPPSFRLDQDTVYFFKIVAAARRNLPPAEITGQFITGTQHVDVIFEKITVTRDGDPGGRGELTFTFGAGDADTKEELGLPWPPDVEDDLGDGEVAYVNRVIRIPHAPRRLWVGVVGEDDDSYYLGPHCTLGRRPSPYGPWTGHAEQEACEQSWVWREFDTFDNGELKTGQRNIDFSPALQTGFFGVAFVVEGRLRINALAGATLKMRMPGWMPGAVGFALDPGRLVTVAAAAGRADMVSLGPDGAVYHKTQSADEFPTSRTQWTCLGGQFTGPLTAVASGPDSVSLFVLGHGGEVFYKSHRDGDQPDAEWEKLGGKFAGPVGAVAGPKGQIELFAVATDGTVFYRTVKKDGRASGNWENLGGKVSGLLAPVYTPRTGLSLFALGLDGMILHKSRSGKEWRPGAAKWDSLGGEFRGWITATYSNDGTMLLVVFAEDRTVHVQRWEHYPEEPPSKRWEKMGTIDSILEGLLSGPEPRSVPAEARPC
jgi:hypothetical protein